MIKEGAWRSSAGEKMSELEPTPELPDKTPTREVRFPTLIKNALFAAGLKTVGEVRETSDEALLSLPDFGRVSVAHLRETLGTGKKQA
jgi:DNA-directed RNA polymerase alpha subunit